MVATPCSCAHSGGDDASSHAHVATAGLLVRPRDRSGGSGASSCASVVAVVVAPAHAHTYVAMTSLLARQCDRGGGGACSCAHVAAAGCSPVHLQCVGGAYLCAHAPRRCCDCGTCSHTCVAAAARSPTAAAAAPSRARPRGRGGSPAHRVAARQWLTSGSCSCAHVEREETMVAVPASIHSRCGYVDRRSSRSAWDGMDSGGGGVIFMAGEGGGQPTAAARQE